MANKDMSIEEVARRAGVTVEFAQKHLAQLIEMPAKLVVKVPLEVAAQAILFVAGKRRSK